MTNTANNVTRRTRAPRAKPTTFRMTNIVATTVSVQLRDTLKDRTPGWTTSRAIRTALDQHSRSVRTYKVPEAYRPPARYQDQINLSTTLTEPGLRELYDGLAHGYGITMSELILRCLCAFVASCPTQDQSP